MIKVFDAEYKFMTLVWERSPVASSELVSVANKMFGWKKSTTYTVIRRLTQRGVLKSEHAIVTALVEKEQIQLAESREFLDKLYGGSLKMFLVSFLEKETITEAEAEELRKIIDKKARREE